MPQYNKALQTYVDRNNDLFNTILAADKHGNIVNPALSEDSQIKHDPTLGFSIINQFGRNAVINSSNVPQDIWESGGLYSGQPVTGTAETITITSDSASDDGLTVIIYGLDGNYIPTFETVTLVGGVGISTAVTTNTFWRSYRASIVSVPVANTSNVGALTATMTTTTSVVFWTISPGYGESAVAAFTIPAGFTGRIKRYRSELLDGALNLANIAIVIKEFSSGIKIVRPSIVINSSKLDIDLYGSIDLPEKTDIVIRVISLTNSDVVDPGADITGSFDLLLEDNTI